MVRTCGTSPVCVCLVHLVSLVYPGWSHTAKQTNQINKRDQPVFAFHAPPSALLRWAMMSLASAMGSVVKGAAC